MEMNDFDICKEYREAKKPNEQLKILAQQNCCSIEDIIEVLKANDEPLRKRVYNRKPAVKKVKPKGKVPVNRKTLETVPPECLDIEVQADKPIPKYVVEAVADRIVYLSDLIEDKKAEVESLIEKRDMLRHWVKEQKV